MTLFSSRAERFVVNIADARAAEIAQVQLAFARYRDDPRLEHLVERLKQIPEARELWARQVVEDDNAVSYRCMRNTGATAITDVDMVTLQCPGHLLVFVPRTHARAEPADAWPAVPAPCRP
jgi:hypothetical protein